MSSLEETPGSPPEPADAGSAGHQFWSRGLVRIRRFTIVLAAVATIAAASLGKPVLAGGVVAGAALGYLNFRWLSASVEALGARIVERQMRESAATVLSRFLLRYLLVAVAGYVIFKISRTGLVGALAGFCLPVAATICEGIYELYSALWRGY